MLKSFLFHSAPLLKKIRKLAFFLSFILIFFLILSSVIVEASDPQFESQQLVDIFGPFIFGTMTVFVVCELLHMLIKSGPIKIEATIFVEGQELSEKQSMAVRMALENYCEGMQVANHKKYQVDENYAVDVLRMIDQRT
ncbi:MULTISPECIES: hypothetical protein [Pseudomonas]|uniref:Uncharacterized protein n=1 Tax=Pseudomonas quercus TaxID=2722792 RepID=A0ABX0YK91_9PSED|nr:MULTISPECIES: hypothetical protein [Pseudomonas]MBF7144890.1 hypothetical protein [Pseudomonas sp. LY10J]NJP03441.1 hypothetical protein [Pseudomonas quercus]